MNQNTECDDVLFTDSEGNRRAAHPLYPLTPDEMQARINDLTRKCIKLEDENDYLRAALAQHLKTAHGLERTAQAADNGAH